MSYTRDIGRDFWFDFDRATLFERTPEIADAMDRAYFSNGLSFDSIMESLRISFAGGDHPDQFMGVVEVGRQGFVDLAQIQLHMMESRLEDAAGIQSAFEDFGQGVLYDDRPGRPPGRRIHMMDGTPQTWVGFHRWHAFARAAVLLGADADSWTHVNRSIALAWAIQSEAAPDVDNPNNPGLPADRIQTLRSIWMTASVGKLDWAFVNHRGLAPAPDMLPQWSVDLGRFAKVQRLLSDAAGDGQPQHLGADFSPLGRFWEGSYGDFMALTTVWGEQLIADPGPNRGERSAMIKILKGNLSGFPRMPPNRPPLGDADIKFIQDWIDADCPEI